MDNKPKDPQASPRATVEPGSNEAYQQSIKEVKEHYNYLQLTGPTLFSAVITTIPHKAQRYNTSGDWGFWDSFLSIKVSQLPDRRECILIAIHELIEAVLCQNAGITQQQVDDFDKEEGNWKNIHPSATYPSGTEPGDMLEAPYYRQHQIATGIERILAAELGVDWATYSRHVEEL